MDGCFIGATRNQVEVWVEDNTRQQRARATPSQLLKHVAAAAVRPLLRP
jgi:hypothetical protein